MHAPATPLPPPHFLMCPPRHFAVSYTINPWMDPLAWRDSADALRGTAERQWQALHRALLASGAVVETVTPVDGLPDLVFTANAAVVLDGTALVANFRHPERRGETPVFTQAFDALRARGLIEKVVPMPDGVTLEGAGDCLWDALRRMFWTGAGFRSDAAAAKVVEATFGVSAVPLTLADPRFYHLDTCLSPLPCGAVMYFPGAFTQDALAAIHARVQPHDRIELSEADAARFCANAVAFGGIVVMSSCSDALQDKLRARGYRVVTTPLNAFLRSGGSACCLTLRLDHRSAVMATKSA